MVKNNARALWIGKALADAEYLDVVEERFNSVVHVFNEDQVGSIFADHSVDIVICGSDCQSIELFKKLRSNPLLVFTPIVYLVDEDSDDFQIQLYSLGVDGIINVPDFGLERFDHFLQGKMLSSIRFKAVVNADIEMYRKRIIQNLSHEFRTPLVAVLTGAEILSRDIAGSRLPEADKWLRLLGAIKRGGQRLERLVNDFVIMQQLEAGIIDKVFESRASWHSVSSLLKQFEDIHRDHVVRDGFSFTVVLEGDDFNLYTYDHHLFSILERLLSNATKFSPQGRDVLLVAHKTDHGNGLFELHDQGPGIGCDNAKKAMEAFEQINRETLEQQGSGLGLTIASQLVQVNRGQLELCDRDQGGTVARVMIPLEWNRLVQYSK